MSSQIYHYTSWSVRVDKRPLVQQVKGDIWVVDDDKFCSKDREIYEATWQGGKATIL
jgi:hypothetical protein